MTPAILDDGPAERPELIVRCVNAHDRCDGGPLPVLRAG